MEHLLVALDRTLSIQQALWAVPLCLTVHNLEEALGVQVLVRELQGLFPWFALNARQFLALLVLVTLGTWGLAVLAAPPDRLAVLLSVQTVLFLNVFVPHVLLSVRLRRYTPGVASAVLVNLPTSLYLLHRLVGAS